MPGYNLKNLKCLIVDDNANMRSLLRTILTSLGMRSKNIIEAYCVKNAMAALGNGDIDLVITDWKMEPVSGIEFVRQLRNEETSPNPFIPIILLTGYTEKEHVLAARDAGVNEFLAKPISPKELYSRILSIIENPRPFIRTPTYFGSDRRRQDLPFEGADRRKTETRVAQG